MELYGFKGTFYNSNAELKGTIKMSPMEISREILKRGHELGGHTLSHPADIKLMPDAQLKFELENVYNGEPLIYLGHFPQGRVNKFCYPRGRHDERVREAVKAAGYLEARTTIVLKIRNHTGDPYQIPTTIQMFQRNEYEGRHWFELAKEYFLKALEESKNDESVFFSIWGHSKELDQAQEWDKFEEILGFMKEHLMLSPHQNGANVPKGI